MVTLDIQLSQALFELGRMLPSQVVVFMSTYLLWILIAAALLASRSCRFYARFAFLSSLFAAALGYVVNAIIGWLYFRPRPFEALGFNPIHFPATQKSFPSDHTTIAWAIAFSVFYYNRRWGLLLMLFALCASLGRMLAGVHYVSDVVGGIIVAGIAAFVARSVLPKKKQQPDSC